MGKYRRPKTHARNSIVLVITEGRKTEPDYLSQLNNLNFIKAGVTLRVKEGKHPAPWYLIEQAIHWEKKYNIGEQPYDMVWIMCDRNTWEQKQFVKLNMWKREKTNIRDFVISNPCFEQWLIWHIKDELCIDANDCLKRLNRLLPDYSKSKIPMDILTINSVQQAISRSLIHQGRCNRPPCTDIHRLIKSILRV